MGNTRAIRVVLGASMAVLWVPGCGSSDHAQPMADVGAPANSPAGGAGSSASPGGMPNNTGAAPNAGAPAGGTGGTTHDVATGTGGTGAAPQPSPDAGSGTGGTAAPQGAVPYLATIHVPNVAAGEEGTVCVQVRLDNQAPIQVVKLHNTLSPASHHFIVSKVTDPAGGEQALAPCQAFLGAVKGAPLSITQKKDDEIVLPAGVSYALGASQVMNLELHYLNTSSAPLDIMAQTELYAAPAGAQLEEATVMLIGTGDISIEPHSTGATGPKYLQLPDGMDGVHFFAITGHTHRFGTNVEVSSSAGPNSPTTLLYSPQPFVWDAPEMKHLDPTVEIPAGGGFSFECEWNNPSDDVIGFGESALAEMCFFWAYYYPKKPVTSVLLDGMDLGLFLGGLP